MYVDTQYSGVQTARQMFSYSSSCCLLS